MRLEIRLINYSHIHRSWLNHHFSNIEHGPHWQDTVIPADKHSRNNFKHRWTRPIDKYFLYLFSWRAFYSRILLKKVHEIILTFSALVRLSTLEVLFKKLRNVILFRIRMQLRSCSWNNSFYFLLRRLSWIHPKIFSNFYSLEDLNTLIIDSITCFWRFNATRLCFSPLFRYFAPVIMNRLSLTLPAFFESPTSIFI